MSAVILAAVCEIQGNGFRCVYPMHRMEKKQSMLDASSLTLKTGFSASPTFDAFNGLKLQRKAKFGNLCLLRDTCSGNWPHCQAKQQDRFQKHDGSSG